MAKDYGTHKPMVEASTSGGKGGGKPEFDHVEASRADNGGWIVKKYYTSPGPMYKPPDELVFGKDEGGKVLAALGKCLGVKGSDEEAGEKEHGA